MTGRVSPLVAPLLSAFLVDVSRVAGRPEVDHTITYWTDRHNHILAATARMHPQTVFDALNGALVETGCCTEDAVWRADEARYHEDRGFTTAAGCVLSTAARLLAEELVGMVRPRWLDLDPVLDLVAANLRAATVLTTPQETST